MIIIYNTLFKCLLNIFLKIYLFIYIKNKYRK